VGKRLASLEVVDVTHSDVLHGRRVLVTGHTGFKGSWLSVWLRFLGADVAGYALDPPTSPNMFSAAQVDRGIADNRGDIRDAPLIRAVVERFNPEVVFHLAAQAIVRDGYRDPVETYATNVVGTAALLDACRRAPALRAIVVVSSDKCYENRDWVWGYRENDLLGGFDPYSSSKACVELVSDAFRRSFFADGLPPVGLATARAGNVIGGGDWARDRLVPDLARAALTDERAMIRSPAAVRPWQHVLEPLGGYLELARRLFADPRAYAGAWNFGPPADSIRTVESVVNALSTRWNGALKWSIDDGDRPHETRRLLLDSGKAADALAWRSRLSFDQAIELAADWYAAARGRDADLRKLTETQIAMYTAKAPSC
jgi:CDP-glucose 4,6-dehydratase